MELYCMSRDMALAASYIAKKFGEGTRIQSRRKGSDDKWIDVVKLCLRNDYEYRVAPDYKILSHGEILKKWFKKRGAVTWVMVEAYSDWLTRGIIYFLKYQSSKDIDMNDPSTGFTAEELSRDFEWK